MADRKRDEQIEALKKIIPSPRTEHPRRPSCSSSSPSSTGRSPGTCTARRCWPSSPPEGSSTADAEVPTQGGSPRVRALPVGDDAPVRDDPARVPHLRAQGRGALQPRLQPVRDRQARTRRSSGTRSCSRATPARSSCPTPTCSWATTPSRWPTTLEQGPEPTTRRPSQSANPRIKSYALYKLAWCDFNAGEPEKALEKLQDVVDYAEKQGKDELHRPQERGAERLGAHVRAARTAPTTPSPTTRRTPARRSQVDPDRQLAYGLAGRRPPRQRHQDASATCSTTTRWPRPAPDFQQAIIKSYEGLRQREQVKAEVQEAGRAVPPGQHLVEGERVEEGGAAQRLQRRRRGDAHRR